MAEEGKLSDDDFISDSQKRIDLHRELALITDPDPQKIILSPDPQATALFLEVLKENADWLHSGSIEDSRGRAIDVIDALVDPEILGTLKHIHKSGRLFAIVQKFGPVSDFVVLDHSLKLQLDSSDTSSHRLRVFVREIGMLTLGQRDIRHLVVHDQRYGEMGRGGSQ